MSSKSKPSCPICSLISTWFFLNQVHIFKHEFFVYLYDKGCLFRSQSFMKACKDAFVVFHITSDSFWRWLPGSAASWWQHGGIHSGKNTSLFLCLFKEPDGCPLRYLRAARYSRRGPGRRVGFQRKELTLLCSLPTISQSQIKSANSQFSTVVMIAW